MEYKKKTIIWEDNNEPPKDYIGAKKDGKFYEYSYATRGGVESKSISGGSGNSDDGGNNEQEEPEITISQAWEKAFFDYSNSYIPNIKPAKICLGMPFGVGSSNEYYERTTDVGDVTLDYINSVPYELHIQTQEDPRVFDINNIPEDICTNSSYYSDNSLEVYFLYSLDELNDKASEIQQLETFAPYNCVHMYNDFGILNISTRGSYSAVDNNVVQMFDGKYYVGTYGGGD